jgi:hypothetical protein
LGESFAGLKPFPVDFRGKICLLLLANLGLSWVADSLASWAYRRLKGRRLCGLTIS